MMTDVQPGDFFFLAGGAVDFNVNKNTPSAMIAICTKRDLNFIYAKEQKFLAQTCIRVRMDPKTINLYPQEK